MATLSPCSVCGENFSNISNFKRHLLTHEESGCSCPHCNFRSSRKDSLKRHLERYHQELASDATCHDVTPKHLQQNTNNSLNSILSANPIFHEEHDKRLQLPHNFIYAGASQSGKTTLLMETLENASKIYNPIPTRVFFFYSCYQDNYTKLQETLAIRGIRCEFVKGSVITEADLDAMADPNGGQTIIIIDDNSISAASSKEMAHIFTIARHKNCSIVLLLHFIFGPWPSSRIISANTAYFFLLKSPRMLKQIAILGSQLGKQKALVSAYEQESKKRYGYVLVDLCTAIPDYQRLRTDIFNENNIGDSQFASKNSSTKTISKEPDVSIQKQIPKAKTDPAKRQKLVESHFKLGDNNKESDSSDNESDQSENESDNENDISEDDDDDNEKEESEDDDESDLQELYRKLIDKRNKKSRWYPW